MLYVANLRTLNSLRNQLIGTMRINTSDPYTRLKAECDFEKKNLNGKVIK